VRLENKVAIVTGGAGGIGRASSRLFAAEGAKVLVADLDEKGARSVAAEIASSGGEASPFAVDVSSAEQVEAMIGEAVNRWGRLDILFNNAGVFADGDESVVTTEEDVWDFTMAVNLMGVYLGCKYGIPARLEGGGGSLINTSSIVALMGSATSQAAYTASKGGVLALTREIAVEFAKQGLRANAICPGPLNTELIEELFSDPHQKQRRFIHMPMGRLGESEEIAKAALFLASDESSFVNGTEFVVDGGMTAAYVTAE
jgi:NAD(P)-dependent dehydrogenase (short-subunit alcohol dehydrogenase family)